MDVKEVGDLEWKDIELDNRDGSMTGEIYTFNVEIERRG